jgi:hypothetical protein
VQDLAQDHGIPLSQTILCGGEFGELPLIDFNILSKRVRTAKLVESAVLAAVVDVESFVWDGKPVLGPKLGQPPWTVVMIAARQSEIVVSAFSLVCNPEFSGRETRGRIWYLCKLEEIAQPATASVLAPLGLHPGETGCAEVVELTY